jgi:hypothetical protein
LRDLDIYGATVKKECYNVLAIASVLCSCDNYLLRDLDVCSVTVKKKRRYSYVEIPNYSDN